MSDDQPISQHEKDKIIAVQLQIVRDTLTIIGLFAAPIVWIIDRFIL